LEPLASGLSPPLEQPPSAAAPANRAEPYSRLRREIWVACIGASNVVVVLVDGTRCALVLASPNIENEPPP
jgi:hypothetical protein